MVDAIEAIIADMERESNSHPVLLGYVVALKIAIRQSAPAPLSPPLFGPLRQGRIVEAMRETKAEEKVSEGERLVTLVGGDSDGTMVPVSPLMPVGAMTWVGGQVYKMTDSHTLTYDEALTLKAKAR